MLASRFDSEAYRQSLFKADTAEALFEAAIAELQPEVKQAQS